MQNGSDLQFLVDLIQTIILFLTRSVVQAQLVAITVVVVLAWFLARGGWNLIGKRFSASVETALSAKKWRITQPGLSALPDITFLLLSMALIRLSYNLFLTGGRFVGLLNNFISLLWAMLAYRLLIALLYTAFNQTSIRHYNYRLFTPLFAFYLASQVLKKNLIDLNILAQIKLFNLFDTPIRLGALFLATVGLYFWVNIVLAIQDMLYYTFAANSTAERGTLEASLTIFRYVMILLGVLMALSTLGLNNTTMAAITGGLSVGIGFALREILGNFMSGLLLLFERSLHLGDIVEMGGEMGVVQELSIRSTTLCTTDNIEIIVPNEKFLTSEVTTYTKSNRLVRVLIPVGVSYDSEPEKVRQVLLSVGLQHQEVEKEPKPTVFFTGLGDSSIDFELAVWLRDARQIKPITSDLYFMIFKAFNQHNIEIPFPQQELHIRHNGLWDIKNLAHFTDIREPIKKTWG